MADWDSTGRVVTKRRGLAFQTLDRAFDFLLSLQKLVEAQSSVYKARLSVLIQALGRVFC